MKTGLGKIIFQTRKETNGEKNWPNFKEIFFKLLEKSHPRITNIQTLLKVPAGVSTNYVVNAVFILVRLCVIRLVSPNVFNIYGQPVRTIQIQASLPTVMNLCHNYAFYQKHNSIRPRRLSQRF